MYRIKNDKRIEKSAAAICDGLYLCLKNKSFSSLTVNEITEAAGVSRATFYRIFDSPLDVLSYLCDQLISDVVSYLVGAMNLSAAQIREGSLQMWLDKADLISAIYNSGKPSILSDCLQKYLKSSYFTGMGVITQEEMDYLQETLSTILDAVLRVWLRHNKKESAREILALYSKIASIIGIIFN
jgi:AcrR family transcriptional regulator